MKRVFVAVALTTGVALTACGGGPTYADKCHAQGGQVVSDPDTVELLPIVISTGKSTTTVLEPQTVHHGHCVVNGQTVSHHDS